MWNTHPGIGVAQVGQLGSVIDRLWHLLWGCVTQNAHFRKSSVSGHLHCGWGQLLAGSLGGLWACCRSSSGGHVAWKACCVSSGPVVVQN